MIDTIKTIDCFSGSRIQTYYHTVSVLNSKAIQYRNRIKFLQATVPFARRFWSDSSEQSEEVYQRKMIYSIIARLVSILNTTARSSSAHSADECICDKTLGNPLEMPVFFTSIHLFSIPPLNFLLKQSLSKEFALFTLLQYRLCVSRLHWFFK